MPIDNEYNRSLKNQLHIINSQFIKNFGEDTNSADFTMGIATKKDAIMGGAILGMDDEYRFAYEPVLNEFSSLGAPPQPRSGIVKNAGTTQPFRDLGDYGQRRLEGGTLLGAIDSMDPSVLLEFAMDMQCRSDRNDFCQRREHMNAGFGAINDAEFREMSSNYNNYGLWMMNPERDATFAQWAEELRLAEEPERDRNQQANRTSISDGRYSDAELDLQRANNLGYTDAQLYNQRYRNNHAVQTVQIERPCAKNPAKTCRLFIPETSFPNGPYTNAELELQRYINNGKTNAEIKNNSYRSPSKQAKWMKKKEAKIDANLNETFGEQREELLTMNKGKPSAKYEKEQNFLKGVGYITDKQAIKERAKNNGFTKAELEAQKKYNSGYTDAQIAKINTAKIVAKRTKKDYNITTMPAKDAKLQHEMVNAIDAIKPEPKKEGGMEAVDWLSGEPPYRGKAKNTKNPEARAKFMAKAKAKAKAKAMEGKGKKTNKRAEIVKKVMAEKGLSLIEASKYVKQNNLY